VAGALIVVASRNLFHSALFLAISFLGVAGLYFLLEAEFIAGIQILIYVGAIVTLIIFAIMLSRDLMDRKARSFNRQWLAAALAAALIFVVLALALLRVPWPQLPTSYAPALTADVGKALVGDYVLPFEVISALLLVALVGSVIIARER
jgi:NADH-quinone oxidoreductase subunit J